MNEPGSLPFHATLQEYQQQAQTLLESLTANDDCGRWRFKWLHPDFRGKSLADVRAASLGATDAQTVIAREYSFENWAELAAFTEAVRKHGPVRQFERAVDAVVSGNIATLRIMLSEQPDLTRARSARCHHATLLHYLAANGVEACRQRTPANALEVATLLLEAGAEVDALGDFYDEKCNTMSLLVSSCHPAEAGLQGALAEVLLDHGAAIEGRGSKWRSPLMTALVFGYLPTAEILARRGAPANDLAAVAGLGRVGETERLLPQADDHARHMALALAAQLGQKEIVRVLLDAGADPNRYNPENLHAHSTPLHQAVCAGHGEVVELLVERGARLDIRDRIYAGTPLGWAIHCQKPALADYLRARGAPE